MTHNSMQTVKNLKLHVKGIKFDVLTGQILKYELVQWIEVMDFPNIIQLYILNKNRVMDNVQKSVFF
jgi:hypothetical protein